MSQKTERNVKEGIANAFGSFGYLSCFLQWFWAVMLYLGPIQSLALFTSSSADEQVEQPTGLTFIFILPDPLETIILVTVVAIMVVVMIYALVTMPKSIVKTSDKIVRKTAETLAPFAIKAQHKQDTKRLRITMTSKLALAIKVLLIVIPVVLAAISGLLEKQTIDYSIVMIIGYGLACLSIAFFAIQYALATLLHVKISDLR